MKAGILIQDLIITLLQFDTKYYYAVGTEETLKKIWFRTPPKSGPDVPYTFGLIGIVKFSQNITCMVMSEFQHNFTIVVYE